MRGLPALEGADWQPFQLAYRAMDHVHPPSPIDGVHDKAFSIRDLASGQQLAWLPVADETAATAVPVLESLVSEHGAPLVVKSDPMQ